MLFRVTVIFPVADLLGAAFSSSCLAVCFPSNRQNCRAVHSSQFYKIAILIEYLVFAVHYTWLFDINKNTTKLRIVHISIIKAFFDIFFVLINLLSIFEAATGGNSHCLCKSLLNKQVGFFYNILI